MPRLHTPRLAALAATLLLPASMLQAQARGAFATNTYRDLFVEDGHSQAEVKVKVDKAFAQIFHGDPETQALYFFSGKNENGPLAYVTDWANHDVRTEGMSYGMMIAVEMNQKAEFDALWNWARTYMYIADPAHPGHGFFSWSCKLDGTPNEETPAPDGEEYYATALYFASARWGDGKGIYDYHAAADELLHAMLHREEVTGPTKFGKRTVSAIFDEKQHMVRFTPSDNGRYFTDPSYHLPAFYELWARWGPVEDRAFWKQAAQVSRRFFVETANPKTALAPAYSNFDGTPRQTGFGQSGIFGFDSWRTASNWSVDWNWFHAAPEEEKLSDRIQGFFSSQGPNYPSVYQLDGVPVGPTGVETGVKHDHSADYDHAAGLVAMNAVASLAATDRKQAREFTEALWNLPIPSGQFRYYNGMLYLLSLLHVSGEFRIYAPGEPTEAKHSRVK